MAMRIATAAKTATPHKLAALRTAMTSKKEMGQWLATAGVFDVLKYVAEDSEQSGELHELINLTRELLLDDDESVEELTLMDTELDNVQLLL